METNSELKALISTLKTRVVELRHEAAALRVRIHNARGRERYDLWNEKRALGDSARGVLLAYAYARNVPYRAVEPKSRNLPETLPPQELHRLAKIHAAWIACYLTPAEAACPIPGTEAAVAAWLTVPETSSRRAKREAAEAAGRQRKEAVRTRIRAEREAATTAA